MHEHFIKRLKERYNIDITVDEYYELCNKENYIGLGSVGIKRKAAILVIKETSVYVIRERKDNINYLVTALPYSKFAKKAREKELNGYDVYQLVEKLKKRKGQVAELYKHFKYCKKSFEWIERNTEDVLVIAEANNLIEYLNETVFKNNKDGETTDI